MEFNTMKIVYNHGFNKLNYRVLMLPIQIIRFVTRLLFPLHNHKLPLINELIL